MTHGQRGRVPIPTNEEIAEAEDLHREIVAVSAIQYGPLNYMKFAFRNGATSTASLGSEGALSLLEALTALFPDHPAGLEADAAKRMTVSGRLEIQSGHMSELED
ncbi:MAG: hypothetical protein WBQ45_09065 [Roseiarcus sp.]